MKSFKDFKNDADIDLTFSGEKKDFKLFMAAAPEELIPVLQRYDNKGDIYFNASDPKLGQQMLEKQQRDGVDAHSLAVDPLFVDPENLVHAKRINHNDHSLFIGG